MGVVVKMAEPIDKRKEGSLGDTSLLHTMVYMCVCVAII